MQNCPFSLGDGIRRISHLPLLSVIAMLMLSVYNHNSNQTKNLPRFLPFWRKGKNTNIVFQDQSFILSDL